MTKYKEDIVRLRSEGKTYREIQESLGCSKGTISYHLGDGQKRKTGERSQKRRTEIRLMIAKIKEEAGCIDCKIMYPYYVLDFDHVNGLKIENIGKMVYWHSIEDILKEIEKCEVVCSNCHRERTHKRSNAAIA
jgi:predicted transcriptional regulator